MALERLFHEAQLCHLKSRHSGLLLCSSKPEFRPTLSLEIFSQQ